jgi:hypothetical protein
MATAYVPSSANNVYEDWDIGALVAHGSRTALEAVHAKICAAVSATDLEGNNRNVVQCLVALAEDDFFDADEELDATHLGEKAPVPVKERPLYRALAALPVRWSAVSAVDDAKDVTRTTEIPFEWPITGGGLAYGQW